VDYNDEIGHKAYFTHLTAYTGGKCSATVCHESP
jgi:hypothetical protein